MTKPTNARPTAEGVEPITPVKRTEPPVVPEIATKDGDAPAPDQVKAPDPTAADLGKPGVDFAVPGNDPSTSEKLTVRTTGDFNLMDPFTHTHIDANSDGTEVVKTSFIANALEAKLLEEA